MTEERPVPDLTIDAGKAGCGDLTPLIKDRMRDLESGQVLEVLSDEPDAYEGVPAWSRLTGNDLLYVEREGRRARFFLRKK